MNCTDFRAAIAESLERRRSPPEDLAAHLDGCDDPRCQVEWDDAVLLQRAIGSWRRTQSQVDVADAVVSGWQAGRRESALPRVSTMRTDHAAVRPSRSTAPRVMVLASAASVVLTGLLLLAPGPDRMVAQHEGRGRPRDPAGAAGLAYVTYAQNAAQIVTDAVVLTLGGADQMEDPKLEPIGIGWEAEWPPLGEVHAALDDLMESLPADPPPS